MFRFFSTLIFVMVAFEHRKAIAAVVPDTTIGFWPFTDVTMSDDVSGYCWDTTAKRTYDVSIASLNHATDGPFGYPATSYELSTGGYVEIVTDQLFNLSSDSTWAMLIKAIPSTPEGPFLQHLPNLNASINPGFTIWTSTATGPETIRLDTREGTYEDACAVSDGWHWLYLSYTAETRKIALSCEDTVIGTGLLNNYTVASKGFTIGCAGQCLDTYISCYMAISKSTLPAFEKSIVKKMCEYCKCFCSNHFQLNGSKFQFFFYPAPKTTANPAMEMHPMVTSYWYFEDFSIPVGSSGNFFNFTNFPNHFFLLIFSSAKVYWLGRVRKCRLCAVFCGVAPRPAWLQSWWNLDQKCKNLK